MPLLLATPESKPSCQLLHTVITVLGSLDDVGAEQMRQFHASIRTYNTHPSTLAGRQSIAVAAKKRKSPSVGGTAQERRTTQTNSQLDAVYNYHPLGLSPPPVTIYPPVSAKFLHMMAQQPTPERLELARLFVSQAVKYYSTEGDRMLNLSSAMGESVCRNILQEDSLNNSGSLIPGGVVYSATAPNGFDTVPAITQAKMRLGMVVVIHLPRPSAPT